MDHARQHWRSIWEGRLSEIEAISGISADIISGVLENAPPERFSEIVGDPGELSSDELVHNLNYLVLSERARWDARFAYGGDEDAPNLSEKRRFLVGAQWNLYVPPEYKGEIFRYGMIDNLDLLGEIRSSVPMYIPPEIEEKNLPYPIRRRAREALFEFKQSYPNIVQLLRRDISTSGVRVPKRVGSLENGRIFAVEVRIGSITRSLPVFQGEYKGVRMTTLSLGFNPGELFDTFDLIMSIDGHPLSTLDEYYRVFKNYPRFNRVLAYQLSQADPSISPMVVDPTANPFSLEIEDLASNLGNLVSIAQALNDMESWMSATSLMPKLREVKIKRSLTPGSRQRLLRYLNLEGREIVPRIRKAIPGLPAAIEDYIDEKDWNSLPEEIRRYTGKPKFVEDPYALMNANNLAVFRAKNIRYLRDADIDPSSITSYTAFDEIFPARSERILQITDINHHLGWSSLAYYLAARGIRVEGDLSELPDGERVAKVLIDFADAGFPSRDEKKRTPIVVADFVARRLHPLSEREVEFLVNTMEIGSPGVRSIINKAALQTILIRGYWDPLPLTVEQLERLKMWERATPRQRELLARLYDGDSTSAGSYVNQPPSNIKSTVESLILYLTPATAKDIAQRLNMILPLGVDPEEYVSEALLSWEPAPPGVDIKSLPLTALTDRQLIYDIIGGTPYYQSRIGLIRKARSITEGERIWFLPIDRKRCDNKITIVSREEVLGQGVIIAFGNREKYYCYDLDDLIGGFSAREGGHPELRIFNPEYESKPGQALFVPLAEAEASELKQYVTGIRDLYREMKVGVSDLERLIQAIDSVFAFRNATSESQRDIIRRFNLLDSKDQATLKTILTDLFELGQRQRRWRGPGHPYVYSTESGAGRGEGDQTSGFGEDGTRFFDPELDVTPYIASLVGKITELEDAKSPAYDLLSDLKIHDVGRMGEPYSERTYTLIPYLNEVTTGEECIRMASSRFIVTGSFYLKLLFNEEIPDFDLSRLVFIY